MPKKPNRPCRHPTCPELSDQVYCPIHRGAYKRESAHQRGYNAKWRSARKRFLQKHPLCVLCQMEGKLTPATVVDHIAPHRGDMRLFWDETNWQALCKRCHDKKTGNFL